MAHKPDHEPSGKFKEGNKAPSSVNANSRCLRTSTKDEVIRSAHSLTLSMESMRFEQDNPKISRLQHITNMAVINNDTAYIFKLLERAIGRARPITEKEADGMENPLDEIKIDQSRLVEIVLQARTMKDEDERKQRAMM